MLGMIDGRAYVVVYTMRGSATRIISTRKVQQEGAIAKYEHNARAGRDPVQSGDLSRREDRRREGDGTTEAEIRMQQREDDADAMQDVARYARRVRQRSASVKQSLPGAVDVPHETIRNWEQGKRCPYRARRALCCGCSTKRRDGAAQTLS